MSRHVQYGFTLIEILIVICIMGALTLVVFPNYIQEQENNTATRLADNFRVLATVFTDFTKGQGHWPEKHEMGKLEEMINDEYPQFSKESIIGGNWEYACDYEFRQFKIRLVGHDAHTHLIERVDDLLDDGNLATGSMTGDQEELVMILQH